jgi:KDO2-lipid IV(A) lauroyltransferase
VTGITEWYTRELERIIRLAPEQYWWLHRRWRDYPPVKAKKSKTPAPPKAA